MKTLKILLVSIFMAGCSGGEDSRDAQTDHDFPEVGQSIKSVKRIFGPSYFRYKIAQGEEVHGYQFYPETGKLAGHQPHIDYSDFVKKVVVLYVSDEKVSKVLIVDGGVTGEMLDGNAFR